MRASTPAIVARRGHLQRHCQRVGGHAHGLQKLFAQHLAGVNRARSVGNGFHGSTPSVEINNFNVTRFSRTTSEIAGPPVGRGEGGGLALVDWGFALSAPMLKGLAWRAESGSASS